MDVVTARVLLVFVTFRFKFKVLCTYSVFILLGRKSFHDPPPNGLLIRTTQKVTPSRVTPIHLPHTDGSADTQSPTLAYRPPGGHRRPGHAATPAGRRGGAGLRRPGLLGSSGAAGAALSALDEKETGASTDWGPHFFPPEMRLALQSCRILNAHLIFDALCNFCFLI